LVAGSRRRRRRDRTAVGIGFLLTYDNQGSAWTRYACGREVGIPQSTCLMLVVLKQVARSRGCAESQSWLGDWVRFGVAISPTSQLCRLELLLNLRISVPTRTNTMEAQSRTCCGTMSTPRQYPASAGSIVGLLHCSRTLRPRTARLISQTIVRPGRAIYSPRPRVSLASHKASNVPQAKCHRLTTPTDDEAGDSRVGPRHSCVMKAGAAVLGVTGPASEGDVAFRSWTDAAMSVHGVISISRQPPAGIVFALLSSKYRDLLRAHRYSGHDYFCHGLPCLCSQTGYSYTCRARVSVAAARRFFQAPRIISHIWISPACTAGIALNIAAQAQRSGIDAGRGDAHGWFRGKVVVRAASIPIDRSPAAATRYWDGRRG
jgi:hypothetical protein